MPYLVITSIFPTDKVQEVVAKYLEVLQKFPEDESLGTQVVPLASRASKNGIELMAIVEVKEDKLQAAINRASESAVMFNSIVGYESSIDVWATAAEAFATLGMTPPEA